MQCWNEWRAGLNGKWCCHPKLKILIVMLITIFMCAKQMQTHPRALVCTDKKME